MARAWTLKWHDGIAVGSPQIDSDHIALLKRINGLNNCLLVQKPSRQRCLQRMRRLLDTSEAHFAHEDEFLLEIGYPLANEHRDIHAELLATLTNNMQSLAREPCDRSWVNKALTMPRALVEHQARGDRASHDFLLARNG